MKNNLILEYIELKKKCDNIHRLIISGVLDESEYKEKRKERFDLNTQLKQLKKDINIQTSNQQQINKYKYVGEFKNKQGLYIKLLKEEIINYKGDKESIELFDRIDSIVNKEGILKTELLR